ncbi:MAG: hypothetical protein AB7S77_11070 [Desulfatirhabdiaceae bacterium]
MQHGSFYAQWLTTPGFRVKPGMTPIRHLLNDYNRVDLHPGRDGPTVFFSFSEHNAGSAAEDFPCYGAIASLQP